MKKFYLIFALLLCILLISCNTSVPDNTSSNTSSDTSSDTSTHTSAHQDGSDSVGTVEPRLDSGTENDGNADSEGSENTEPSITEPSITEPSGNDTQDKDNKANQNMNEFILKARVLGMNGTHLEVEVTESDYAFGVYWVIVPSTTPILNTQGKEISVTDLNAGDTVQITYNGQTMMSYPPQIVALSIAVE